MASEWRQRHHAGRKIPVRGKASKLVDPRLRIPEDARDFRHQVLARYGALTPLVAERGTLRILMSGHC
jgi:hypothetical protein